jgi:hypothetical protein
MPTHHQMTVEAVSTERGFGSSDTSTLQQMFPASPIHGGVLTAASVLEMGNELLVGTEVNDGGHTFGTFNRDYVDAPVPGDVAVGGGGLPGSPYAPAPGSPGPGSMNPADIPAPPSDWPGPSGTEYGVGNGLASPAVESQKIAGQTIGDYLFGKSSA